MTARRWWLVFFAIGFTVGCVVSLTDDLAYSCTTDADCGGGGFVCATPAGLAPRCCKPGAPELCNGRDDNCNGQIDEGFPAETCNGLDDDCDGQIDETFNLLTDSANCGRCGNACGSTQMCANGACVARGELLCGDGIDNDNDSKVDCADNDCNNQSCGVGCTCRGLAKVETDCTNLSDDDGDGKVDCADSDCEGVACSGGCLCKGGVRTESACNDGVDNDGDGGADCADPTCNGKLCQTSPKTFTCVGSSCTCRDAGTLPAAESGAARCRNGIDDDCNGLTDCQETACNGFSCASDGGLDCQCRDGGQVETNCADRIDNDGDFRTDCGEMLVDGGGECPVGTRCTYVQGIVRDGGCKWDTANQQGICSP